MSGGIKKLDTESRIAFVLALGAGLRWEEIVSLKWEDVQTERVRVAAANARARRARMLPIGEMVRHVLEKARGQDLVVGGDRKEIHGKLCDWLRNQGVKDAKPVHYLRKFLGPWQSRTTGFSLPKLLGHSSITSTASTYARQVD